MLGLCDETYTLICRLNIRDVVISAVLDALRYPSHSKFNAARDIPIGLMGTHGHEHVGEVLHSYAQERPWAFLPFV